MKEDSGYVSIKPNFLSLKNVLHHSDHCEKLNDTRYGISVSQYIMCRWCFERVSSLRRY